MGKEREALELTIFGGVFPTKFGATGLVGTLGRQAKPIGILLACLDEEPRYHTLDTLVL